ncbi:hypothetical protein D9619_001455 [Psilocybe cf. subviscida]|uniref:Plasma membrane fusion protein PRM1 n=1 Tax=Psilocybe cf. subviscida TaxID=2480587 RepID=A0A8H5BF21_9AGAR|nr:hypothetical protein D9619_001455 [Psilocybe cf. subviscida]
MSAAVWNSPPPVYDSSSTTTTLTPYLTLPHLLSLTWLAYPILSLIFVAFRLQLSLADAQDAVSSAKDNLLASCKAAEEAATSTASMPRYMALAANQQYADAVNASLNAFRGALVLALTVMEAVINFIIDLYRSTFLCFLELVVRGGLAILLGAVQEINAVVGTVASALRTSIQSDIAGANKVIQTAIDAVNKINPFNDITAPQISVPSLDALQNVTLPQSFTDAITNLNNSIPSVADIKGKIEAVIDTPFELLKKDINDTFASITFTPDGLPVPEVNRLSFCGDMDTSVIDDIGKDFIKAAKIGVVIIILLALALVGLNCLFTWYKWRCMKNHLEYTRQAWMTDPTMVHNQAAASKSPAITLSDHNLMLLNANSEHPLITRILNQISARFRLTPSQHTNAQWFLSYIFHPPALACFLIGFIGLLSVQIQLAALGPLVAKYEDRAASASSDFSTTIATSISQSMYNQSAVYATEVNGQVDVIQNTINNGMFGWVNGTTTTLNATINEFYTDIQDAVTTVFGGTILDGPAQEFIRCFIGGKVDAIENALTFLHDNLIVNIPRVNETALVISPESINEASQPIAAAALGGGSGDGENQGLVARLVQSYAASLKKERIMFAIFIALWGVVVLMGFGVVFWHAYGRAYLERRGRRRWEVEQRSGFDGISPFGAHRAGSSMDTMISAGAGLDKEKGGFGGSLKQTRSFSPLPSPRQSTFKPFWPSRANSPAAAASQESLTAQRNVNRDSRPWETAFAPPMVQQKNGGGAKLLAIGRRAMGRSERLKPDGSDEEVGVDETQPSAQKISEPVGLGASASVSAPRNTAWFGKMATLLTRKDTNKASDADFWDKSAATPSAEKPTRPTLRVRIQTEDGVHDLTEEEEQTANKSRWSTTPDAKKNYFTIMSPTRKNTQQASPAPPVAYVDFPYPPIGVPIVSARPTQQDLPHDVGLTYNDDPFANPSSPLTAELPMPLYNGFESHNFPTPPRHPQLQAAFRMRGGDASPPPPLASPRMLQPHTALRPAPSPSDRHRRASSMGAISQWRVTNAVPGDTTPASSIASFSMVADNNKKTTSNNNSSSNLNNNYLVPDSDMVQASVTPVTRFLTTTHARQSSNVNPFMTPFDDEHRVQIDHPTGLAARKSIPINPFATHAI